MQPLNLRNDAPWRERFRTAIIAYAFTAAANPTRGLACTNQTGVFQLYAWDVPTGQLTQLTHHERGKIVGSISADGQFIYYLNDDKGNELGHYVRVPFAGGPAQDITPNLPLYSSFGVNHSQAGNRIGFMTAGRDGFQANIMDAAADGTLGEPRPLWHSRALSFGPTLSQGGEIGVVATTERTGRNEYSLVAFDLTTGDKIGELGDENTSIQPARFSPVPGDMRLAATSNQSGFMRPLIWNPRTNERTDLALPDLGGEISVWDWSPDGQCLLLRQLNQAEYQLYLYDLRDNRLHKLNHPGGTVGGFSGGQFMPDDEIFLTWQNATTPAQLVALDAHTGEMKRTVLAAADAPGGRPWSSVSFPSTNGATIQAWVATPEGAGPFPTILHIHGGPTAVTTEAYSPEAQAYLDHGFAFLSINYRGSTTFGKEFEQAIWGNLGQWEVDDLAAAHDWLITHGIADPDAILLTGGSYGGYLTLQGLGKRPELWAGGMATVAIADWALMYEDQAETLRGYQRALFGGTPDEKPDAHRAASPLTYAEAVSAPILVIQGANDTRCPARQMQVYEEKLNSLGKSIRIHWFDAGHGSYQNEQQIEHQEMKLRFAYQLLG
ncbi:MAG: S9 family peptidase [Chloroflexi bacterium]|nr:S9 family peptidase [Chloroflexota bacterium]MBP8058011.1 S9 family peptidase [Chloroflexota bacterium]